MILILIYRFEKITVPIFIFSSSRFCLFSLLFSMMVWSPLARRCRARNSAAKAWNSDSGPPRSRRTFHLPSFPLRSVWFVENVLIKPKDDFHADLVVKNADGKRSTYEEELEKRPRTENLKRREWGGLAASNARDTFVKSKWAAKRRIIRPVGTKEPNRDDNLDSVRGVWSDK